MSGEKISNIDVGPVDLWTLAFSPDNKFIISGSHAGKISVYSVESSKQEHTLDTRGKFILSVAYVRIQIQYLLANSHCNYNFNRARTENT